MGAHPGIALVAVGGYGRGELSPHSDIDLLFLTSPRSDVNAATLRGLLYPLWDAGFQVGHAVRSPKAAFERAQQDLDAATSLLAARFVAGDAELFEELIDRRDRWVRKERTRLARRILAGRTERHQRVERAGWTLAPDIKDDVGGLRDVHTVRWLIALSDGGAIDRPLAEAEAALLAAREALHAEMKRKSDRIRIDLQRAVARHLGYDAAAGPDLLMAEVHGAARAIEHHGELAVQELTDRLLGGPRRSGQVQQLSADVRIEDGRIVASERPSDHVAGLRTVAAASRTGKQVARRTIAWIEEVLRAPPQEPWPRDLAEAFDDVLAGDHCVGALELLDNVGAWDVLIPEWSRIRKLAQYDPYHRYTVDAHSFTAVGELQRAIADDTVARVAADDVGDLGALRLGTLFHDIGKGSGTDHSIAGEVLARAACRRMGLASDLVDDVATLVRHHLLLPDTATRRDLDDGAVIAAVAATIGTARRLRMLYILAIADGRATGPEAWNEWKATLVRELYVKTLTALETGDLPIRSDVAARAREVEAYEPALAGRSEDILATLPPSYLQATVVEDAVDDIRLLLQAPRAGEVRHRVDPGMEPGHFAVTVCAPDRPGTLARTTGVLALHRMSVLRAQAYSTDAGLALERFVVIAPPDADWDGLARDLDAAYAGRLAVEARLERKIADYHAGPVGVPDIRVLPDESPQSTVIEVRAPDALGLLHAITAALSELDLDIHVAKIDTLGPRVVDVFYVRDATGGKLDEAQAAEVARAIEHRVTRLLGP